MKYNHLISIFLLPFMMGLAILGDGLTGNVVFDSNVKSICETNNDCANKEACCLFFEQTNGVCSEESNCQAIYDVTRKETEKGITDGLLNQALASSLEQEKNRNSIIFGSIILTFIGLIIVSYIGFDIIYSKTEKIIKKHDTK